MEEPLTPQQERWLAENDFWFFSKFVLELDIVPHVHGDMYNLLGSEGWRECLILMPRETFKTSAGTAAYAVWRICKDRNVRIMLFSETYTKAKEIVGLGRSYLERKPHVERLFGTFKSQEKWSEDSFTVTGRTRQWREPTLSCAGIEALKPGGHYEVIIFDDPESHDTVNTPELVQKTRNVDRLSYPMLEPGGKRLTFGTRWDDNDLYGHKMELFGVFEDGGKSKDGKFRVILKRAEKDDGSPLFPERLDKERLADLKREMGAAAYSAQYLNDPISHEDATFRDTDFDYSEEIPTEGQYWVGVDCARSKAYQADYCGFVVALVTPEYKFHIVEAFRKRLDTNELMEELFRLDLVYAKPRFVIEEDNYTAGWQPLFAQRQQERRNFLLAEWIKAGSRIKKEHRIIALQGLFRNKRVQLTRNSEILEQEGLRFPRGKHDDVLDAMTNIVECAQRGPKTQIPKPNWGRGRFFAVTPPWVKKKYSRRPAWVSMV